MASSGIFKVAIIGRPNVGKSSLFNIFLGSRRSIVDSQSGITRDRVAARVSLRHKKFELFDTGGIFEGAENTIESGLLEQVKAAIKEADLMLFVVDGQMGLHPMDQQIWMDLVKEGKPVLPIINKVDNDSIEMNMYEFMSLGFDLYFPVSALHRRGFEALEKELVKRIPEDRSFAEETLKISIVGKPNVGKSSLVNRILGMDRTIVSEIPGTTRDSIFVPFKHGDKSLTLIDTAGLTRRGRFKEPVDAYSVMRSKDSVEQSDLVVLMFDADRNIEMQDRKIANMIMDEGKGCIMVVNKWDLTKNVRQEHYLRNLREDLPWLRFAPVVFTSVLQGRNHLKVLDLALEVWEKGRFRISTNVFNDFLHKIVSFKPPQMVKGKRLKIYYGTQVTDTPPTFVLFVNSGRIAARNYILYIQNRIRKEFGFDGMPVRIQLKDRGREKSIKS